jgi:hypothetical protein
MTRTNKLKLFAFAVAGIFLFPCRGGLETATTKHEVVISFPFHNSNADITKTVEISFETKDPSILNAINKINISGKDVIDTIDTIYKLGLDRILGLRLNVCLRENLSD